MIAAGILLCVGVQMSIHRYLHHESHPHKTKPWDVLAAPGSGSPGRPERKLPAGWKETIDPNTRLPYFYNENVRARPPQTPMRLSLAREAAVTRSALFFLMPAINERTNSAQTRSTLTPAPIA